MNKSEAVALCTPFLEAWTGNRPETLLAFYDAQATYRDPARPAGLTGHAELRAYFTRLLAANPDWVWHMREVHPTEKGFTLKWRASIPTPSGLVEEDGLDIVEVVNGKITRNEVYFERSSLLKAAGAAVK